MTTEQDDDLGFDFHMTKNDQVLIKRDGATVTILRGEKAGLFKTKISQMGFAEQQQWMARLTGNYKRGNERQSKRGNNR